MGRPLCMYTYSRMFSSCVIPGEECDEMRDYPNDAKHILVLRNNCIWSIQVFDDNGEEIPLADILRQFELVREEATGLFDLERYPPVSVLTSENRTNWAKVRRHAVLTRAGMILMESSSLLKPGSQPHHVTRRHQQGVVRNH
jgi:hypothetical protein